MIVKKPVKDITNNRKFKVKKDMKKIFMLNNSQGVIGLLLGLKSRITSTKPLLTMLALLMVCLFGVNENVWGDDCKYSETRNTYNTSIKNSGTVIAEYSFTNSYGLHSFSYTLTLTCAAAGKDLTYKIQYLPKNSDTWTDTEISTGTLNGTWMAWRSESSESKNVTISSSSPIFNARGIRLVSTKQFGGNRTVAVSGVKFVMEKSLSIVSTNINFGDVTIGNNPDSTRSITYSCEATGKTMSVTRTSGSTDFTAWLSEENLDCFGSRTLTVRFKPSSEGPKSATFKVSSTNGANDVSFTVSGTGKPVVAPIYRWRDVETISKDMSDDLYVEGSSLNLSTLWTSSNTSSAKLYKKIKFSPASGVHTGAKEPAIAADGYTLSLGQAGVVELELAQDAATGYYAGKDTIRLTIKRNANTLYANSDADYHPTMQMGKNLAVTLTATNTDYTGSPIQLVKQTAGDNTVAVFDYTQNTHSGTVHSKYKKDVTATWSIHQDENYKYLEGNGTFSVDVKTASENTCYVLENQSNTEKDWHGNTCHEHTWNEENVAGELKFDISKDGGLYMAYRIQQLVNGNWEQTDELEDYSTSWQTKTFTLNQAAKGVRFYFKGGSYSYVRNVSVKRKTYINASNLTIDKTSTNNPVYPSDGVGVGTLPISYSLANGGNLKIANDNSKFNISPSEINVSDCNGGSANISIQYQSTTAGTDVAHLVIYNDVYRKEVTITGITSKRTQVVNWEVGDVVRLGSETENAAWVISGNTVSYSSNATDIIDVVNGKLVAKGVGSAVITATADGNGDYNDAYDTKTIEVTNDEIQWIEWSQTFLRLKVGGSNVTLEASAQSDVEGCTTNGARPITYSSAKESVVRVDNNTKQLVIVGAGTTVITATQAGGTDKDGHKYMAVSQEKTVIVRDPSAPCENYLYIQPTENEWYCGWNHANRQYKEFIIDNLVEPSDISLQYKGEYKTVWGVGYFYGTIHVEEWYDNAWHDISGNLNPSIGNYQTFSHVLTRSTTKVRISTHDGVGYHYFNECKIGQSRYIETNTLDAYEAKVGQTVNQILSISYDNIVGDITLALGHKESNFSISQNVITGDCGDRATVDITVSYTPQAATGNEGEAETLTITDDETTKEITLHGSATVTERYILWDIPETNDKFTVESVELTAAALTKVGNNPAGEVFYSLGGLSTTGTINEDDAILTFAKDGIAYVSAEGKTSASYNTPAAVTKTFNVSKTPTSISVAPTVETIVSGTAAEDVVLNTASAVSVYDVNGFSGTVPGTWSVIEEDLNTVGENRSIKIHFEPSNTDMFIGCDGYINNVTVSQREATEEEVIGAATAITYGETAAGASTLSNDGTLAGTWAWTDSRKNDQLAVGTYDDMQARFTPNNGNIQPKDITVSLTVNQATPTLNWTSAATELAYNASATYTATSTSNEGAITYSIETGASYAEIDENTGALTIIEAGHDITVKATQAASANYIAASITVNVTIAATPIVNTFIGNGGWENPNNWSEKVVPTESDPNVIVSGALSIDENVTVGNLTIESTGSIAVITGGTLTVKGVSEYRAEYGDVHVLNDGALALTNSANLQVRHFTLDAKLAGKNNANVKEAAASGQVENPNQLAINGDAYFQMAFDPKGKISFGWYDFVVPFPVNISDGIFREGDLVNHLVSGVDFIVQEHSESKCANNQKAWTNFYGTMEPGRVYTIGFNYDPNFDQNVFVFKKANGAIIGGPTEFATQYTEGSGTTDDYGWNGLGNGMLKHGYVTGTFAHMQVYNHAENKYDMLTGKNPTFAIGTSFFVQVDNSTPTMEWHAANANEDHPLFAPKREAIEVEEFLLSLREENQVDASDHLYISASEEATEAYVIGRDLRKMGTPTEAKTAQMWTTKGGKNLCDIETRMVNYKASSDLYFFAPQATTFELTAEEMPENATLYLTKNGKAIWNLSMSPYELNLEQGTTEGYGLRIVASQQTTTDIENGGLLNDANGVRKVLIDNVIYIVTPEGEMYDLMGKSVNY